MTTTPHDRALEKAAQIQFEEVVASVGIPRMGIRTLPWDELIEHKERYTLAMQKGMQAYLVALLDDPETVEMAARVICAATNPDMLTAAGKPYWANYTENAKSVFTAIKRVAGIL